jgi:hypothetical protein
MPCAECEAIWPQLLFYEPFFNEVAKLDPRAALPNSVGLAYRAIGDVQSPKELAQALLQLAAMAYYVSTQIDPSGHFLRSEHSLTAPSNKNAN